MNIWAPTVVTLDPTENRKGSGAQLFVSKALARVVAQSCLLTLPGSMRQVDLFKQ